MKKIIILIFCVQFPFSAFSSEVWVTYAGVVTREKLVSLSKKYSEEIKEAEVFSLFEKLLREPLSASLNERVINFTSQAEGWALKGNFKLAISEYEKLLKELRETPKVLGLQKVIRNTYIRLAENYDAIKDQEKSNQFLSKALAWDPIMVLDPQVFSPKIRARIEKQKKHLKFTSVKIHAPVGATVYIDGRRIGENLLRNSVKIPVGFHQAASLAPGGLWQTTDIHLNLKNNLRVNINFQSFASGSCDNPKFKNINMPASTKILVVFDQCERVYDGKNIFSYQGEKISGDGVQVTLAQGSSHEQNLHQSLLGGLEKENESWFKKSIRSPWFWLGIGALTAGTISIIRAQETSPVVVPTHTAN